jgi:hypothetical protein
VSAVDLDIGGAEKVLDGFPGSCHRNRIETENRPMQIKIA